MKQKARPPLTANEPKLGPNGAFQTTRGPAAGQGVRIFSGVEPSSFGPRYCGQSAAARGVTVQSDKRTTGRGMGFS